MVARGHERVLNDCDTGACVCCRRRIVAIVQDRRRRGGDDALMNTVTSTRTIAVGRAARHPLRRAVDWLRTRWRDASLDAQTRYLSQAADHADLERRLRALERCACRPPC
jgi:hypothetical protein